MAGSLLISPFVSLCLAFARRDTKSKKKVHKGGVTSSREEDRGVPYQRLLQPQRAGLSGLDLAVAVCQHLLQGAGFFFFQVVLLQ